MNSPGFCTYIWSQGPQNLSGFCTYIGFKTQKFPWTGGSTYWLVFRSWCSPDNLGHLPEAYARVQTICMVGIYLHLDNFHFGWHRPPRWFLGVLGYIWKLIWWSDFLMLQILDFVRSLLCGLWHFRSMSGAYCCLHMTVPNPFLASCTFKLVSSSILCVLTWN